MKNRTVALVVGTRPEAIKMAPVHRALRAEPDLTPVLISVGQHRELLESALRALELEPDCRLSVMAAGQTPNAVICRVLNRLTPLLLSLKPDALLVQGDTSTVLAAGLAAYNQGILVGHVEAGLRTYNHDHPFPEEANRQLVDRISRWCFAPTTQARDNLLSERIETSRIFVTGNTAVDSLLWMVDRIGNVDPTPTLLVTLHRRESFGSPLKEILAGIRDFLDSEPTARAVWPVHPNPNVRHVSRQIFADCKQIDLVAPLDYASFVAALTSCRLVLSDSGGIQEEAPSVGKTVLIARETTERPEALDLGTNRLVGRTRQKIRVALQEAWPMAPYDGPLPAPNPYGDGCSGKRICSLISSALLDG